MRRYVLLSWTALALGSLAGTATAAEPDPPRPGEMAPLIPPVAGMDAPAPTFHQTGCYFDRPGDRHAQFVAGGGFYFLRPYFSSNPAFSVNRSVSARSVAADFVNTT